MTASDEETREPWPARGLTPGTVLNGLYRVDHRLGKGGMGEVYRATSLADGKPYAIKAIGQAISEHPEAIERFRREADIQQRIESTAVARLRMFCHDTTLDLFYFVLDFIEGESLLDRLKRQPGAPGEVRALLRRAATALGAVHEAQAVHRDVSPDNIILPDGDIGRAKLIDFGIVKELGSAPQTMGLEMGKYGYMPPEQLRIAPDNRIGPWSDLYSLALTALAFARGRPLAMGYSTNSASEARQRPVDLSAAPDELRPLLARMLAFDWRERPRSAAEVLALLDAADRDTAAPTPPLPGSPDEERAEPVTVVPEEDGEPSGTGLRSASRRVAIAAGALVASVAAVVLLQPRPPAETVQPAAAVVAPPHAAAPAPSGAEAAVPRPVPSPTATATPAAVALASPAFCKAARASFTNLTSKAVADARVGVLARSWQRCGKPVILVRLALADGPSPAEKQRYGADARKALRSDPLFAGAQARVVIVALPADASIPPTPPATGVPGSGYHLPACGGYTQPPDCVAPARRQVFRMDLSFAAGTPR